MLGDANVLYSRVLRDYLLYAMTQRLIRVRWSNEILAEVVKHLSANLDGFDQTAGERLICAMNRAFPNSEIAVDPAAKTIAAGLILPDENDRHGLAASVAAEADILCTNNVKDFPTETMAQLGIELMSADELLSLLVTEFPVEMVGAHELTVSRLHGASDVSTLAALRRAGAGRAANLLAELLNVATARRSTFRGERRAARLARSSAPAPATLIAPATPRHTPALAR